MEALPRRQFEIDRDEDEESEDENSDAAWDSSSFGAASVASSFLQQDFGDIDTFDDIPNAHPAEDPADLEAFFAMLYEYKADPFGTWDTERSKVVDDERYDLLDTMKARRRAFGDWALQEFERRRGPHKKDPDVDSETWCAEPSLVVMRALAAATPKTLPIPTKDPVVQFLRFVQPRFDKKKYPSYVDFKRKFRATPEFAAAGARLADKVRENLYRQYVVVACKPWQERVAAYRDALAQHALTSTEELPAALLKDPRFHTLPEEMQWEEAARYVKKL